MHKYIDLSQVPKHVQAQLATNVNIVPSFLSAATQTTLERAASAKLRRLSRGPHLDVHFDGVIKGFKEASVSAWASQRIWSLEDIVDLPSLVPPLKVTLEENNIDDLALKLFFTNLELAVNALLLKHHAPENTDKVTPFVKRWLPPHILELRESDSGIGPHVDHTSAFGSVIAGLCLGSDAVMRFTGVLPENKGHQFSVLLPKGALLKSRVWNMEGRVERLSTKKGMCDVM
ncbi:hypothetical protein HDU79_007061 [Rhizoclosmatium sp. JEL0117]|nr:hypothetical protein HDU79_007061 [Rhizoclosmatium sp. JEL0117]